MLLAVTHIRSVNVPSAARNWYSCWSYTRSLQPSRRTRRYAVNQAWRYACWWCHRHFIVILFAQVKTKHMLHNVDYNVQIWTADFRQWWDILLRGFHETSGGRRPRAMCGNLKAVFLRYWDPAHVTGQQPQLQQQRLGQPPVPLTWDHRVGSELGLGLFCRCWGYAL